MSKPKWKNWCRLCARADGGSELKLDTVKSISYILQTYFRISISKSDDCLSVVCQDCIDLVLNVEKFALRCGKVNKMFVELANGSISDVTAAESIRETYGLYGRYEYINCEVSLFEEKPEPILESECEKPDSNYAGSLADEDSDKDEDASYTPALNKKRTRPKADSQPKPKKRKQYTIAKSSKSPVKKNSKPIESKHKSTKRKPIKGTDVWCHLCDTTFILPRFYMEHMRKTHTPDVLPFVCAQCPKAFVSEQKMLRHAACHRPDEQKKIHPCSECNKTFSTVKIVQFHIRNVHMGERPFICEECGKACSTKASLKDHQMSHSDERPFKCNDCPKCFKDLIALKRHLTTHNTTSFECVQCGQKLNTLRTLRNHMLVHSDKKRYKCQHCGNEYKRHHALKNHLILHTGLRPYACPFCDVTYANGSNLRTHKKKCHPLELAAMEAAGRIATPTVITNTKYLQPSTTS